MFDYTIETENNVDDTIENLKQNLLRENFGVLWEFDIKEKLQEKRLGFDESYIVLEVCNPHEAKRVLEKNKMVGYFLPCKIVVYSDQGTTKIGMPKPSSFIQLMKDEELNKIAMDIEKRLILAIDQSI